MSRHRAFGVFAAALVAASGNWISLQGQRGQPTPTNGTALLVGQVIEYPSGRPVPQATVVLIGRSGPPIGRGGPPNPPVMADSQGRFFFSDLVAGTYALQVTKPGYSAATIANLSRTTDLGDGEHVTDLKIRLAKLASLAGSLRDDAGDPVVGTDVIALRRTIVNGRPVLRPSGQNRTDDRGAYRVANLQAGDYVICACRRDPIPFDGLLLTTLASEPLQLLGVAARALTAGADVASLDDTLRTFAPTFYPSSASVARATRVTLAPGDEKLGLDIILDPIRATRVSGRVVGAPSPVVASSMRLVPAGESEEGASLATLQPTLVQPDGRFDFSGVPPGSYVLRIIHTVFSPGNGAPSGAALAFLGNRGGGALGSVGNQLDEPPLWAAEPITVGDDGVRGLSVMLRRATKIDGHVQFVGSAPQPTAQVVSRAAVFVQPVSPDPARPGESGLGRVAADATFQVRGVVPGRYIFSATAAQGWPTLKSVTVAGVDVTDMPVEIDATDVRDVVLTFTDTPMATLSGTMPGGSRGPAEDVSALVFPADRRYWRDPGAAFRRFRTQPIGRNASFTMGGLPAGEYFVVIVTDEMASEWQEASRLETLSSAAQRVTLADGEKKMLELRR